MNYKSLLSKESISMYLEGALGCFSFETLKPTWFISKSYWLAFMWVYDSILSARLVPFERLVRNEHMTYFYCCVIFCKDTMKPFDNFKNKQKCVWSNFFTYIYAKVCIFWKCIQYTIHWIQYTIHTIVNFRTK